MKHLITIMLAGCMITACNNEQSKPALAPAEVAAKTSMACYAGNSGRDTINLSLQTTGNDVTGQLDYRFYEKDQNHGSFSGHLSGDTIIADYNFSSEGQQSIRQVAFLKKGDALVEGYGDMEEKDGKLIFKNTTALDFSDNLMLQKTPCK